LALGLVFHELATNAAKYGALSTAAGRVSVRWTTADDVSGRHLAIEWAESGGPPVAAPARRGFGSRLVERSLHGASGEAHLEFRPAGVVARLRLRLGAAGSEAEDRCGAAAGPVAAQAPPRAEQAPGGGAMGGLSEARP
jgi:two-component sensor histidine kinase